MNNIKIQKIMMYHGPLEVTEKEGKYYLVLPNFDADYYQEIPNQLYKTLLDYEADTDFSGHSTTDNPYDE